VELPPVSQSRSARGWDDDTRTSLGKRISAKQGYIFVWLRMGYRSVVKSALAL
jgi:hypothetical protein